MDLGTQQLYINLYKNYNLKEQKITSLDVVDNKVYTVNDRKLTQKGRIILELSQLDSMMKKNDLVDSNIIDYLKKCISILQAYLWMNIKFFNKY